MKLPQDPQLVPFYDEGGITIYCGDNRRILPLLGEFDLLLTDPPYGIGVGRRSGVGSASVKGRYKEYGKADWDDAPAPGWMLDLARERTRWQIVWGGNYFGLPPGPCWLVWDKGQREFSLADAELAWTNLEGAVRVMEYSRIRLVHEGKYHPTQKPEPLMGWCLNFVPKAKSVVDPWMGCGTTLVAAKARGLRAVGIEREVRFCEAAVARLAQGVLELAV